jgi:hypothetical protein
MGKLAAFLLLLVGTTQSPVFVYALQTKAKPAIHLLQDLTLEQHQQDLPGDTHHFELDESDDCKLPLYRVLLSEPLAKDIENFSDHYQLVAILHRNYAIATPPPEC